MRNTCIIRRRSAKSNGEHLVIIVILQEKQPCTALLMLKDQGLGANFFYRRFSQQPETAHHIIYIQRNDLPAFISVVLCHYNISRENSKPSRKIAGHKKKPARPSLTGFRKSLCNE
jgi:hypothetical protein